MDYKVGANPQKLVYQKHVSNYFTGKKKKQLEIDYSTTCNQGRNDAMVACMDFRFTKMGVMQSPNGLSTNMSLQKKKCRIAKERSCTTSRCVCYMLQEVCYDMVACMDFRFTKMGVTYIPNGLSTSMQQQKKKHNKKIIQESYIVKERSCTTTSYKRFVTSMYVCMYVHYKRPYSTSY